MRTIAIGLVAVACGSKAPPVRLENHEPASAAHVGSSLHVRVRCHFPNGVAALLTEADYQEDHSKHLMETLIIDMAVVGVDPPKAKTCDEDGAVFDVEPGSYELVVGQNIDDQGNYHAVKPRAVRETMDVDLGPKDITDVIPCVSCPYLYVWDGTGFAPRGQVLRDIRSPAAEREERTPVELVVVGKTIRLRLAEEEDEVSHVDALLLDVGGKLVSPDVAALAGVDQRYDELRRGDSVELVYHVELPDGPTPVTVVARGYYLPLVAH